MIDVFIPPMDRDQRQRLGELIRELRGETSQRQFAAKQLECSYAALRSWEEGESVPGLENLERIAQLKGWSLSQLLAYVRGEEHGGEKPATLEALAEQARSLPKTDRVRLARILLETVE